MEFARRGPATAAADERVVEEGRRYADPPLPPQGDTMLVIRDALLLQLHKDRLRQEIIMAELAKIERAMALSSASCHSIFAGDLEWAKLPSFSFGEKFIPHRRWPASLEHWADVDGHHDLKAAAGARQEGLESRSMRPDMDDHVSKCLRPCCTSKEREENAALDEQKLQEYNEASTFMLNTQPKESSPLVKWELTGITMSVKKPKSPQKWSCTICHVETISERQLREHCAGKKHRSNLATLESRNKAISNKAETTTVPSSCAGQKASPINWSCSTCLASGTSEADLKDHLNGSSHKRNIEEQCKEGYGMSRIEPQEAESHMSNVPQHAEKPPLWSCSICRANCTRESELGSQLSAKIQVPLVHEINNMVRNSESWGAKLPPNIVPQHAEQTTRSSCSIHQANCDQQSDLADHFGGEIHQLKIQVLHEEAKQTENIPPRIDKNQPASEWDCSVCEAKCFTESQFENHCRGKRHRKKIKALKGEGAEAKLCDLKTENKDPSVGSDSMTATSHKVEEQMTPCVCDICNLLCSSKNISAGRCSREEHLEEQKLLNFCEVCDLQCNSGKMLLHHCTGKKHLKKLNATK
ncbi:hypothetical protein EJB05_43048, partial [Eragrostis curvula]